MMEQLWEVKELESRDDALNAQLTLTILEGEDQDSKFYYTLVGKKGRKLEVTQNKRILMLVLRKNKKYQLGYIEKVKHLPFHKVPQMKYNKELDCIKHFYIEREILIFHFKDEEDNWQMVFQNGDLAVRWYQLIKSAKDQERRKTIQNQQIHSYSVIFPDQLEESEASMMLMLNKSKSSISEKAEEIEREMERGDKRGLYQSFLMKEQVYQKNRWKMKESIKIQRNQQIQLDILKREIQEEREKGEQQAQLIKEMQAREEKVRQEKSQMQAREEKVKQQNEALRKELRKREEGQEKVQSENRKLKKELKQLTKTSEIMLKKEVNTIFFQVEHKRYLQIQQQLFKQQIKTKELEWKYQRLEAEFQQKQKYIQQLQEQMLQPAYPYDDEDTSQDMHDDSS